MGWRRFRDCLGCVFVQSVRIKAIKNDWHLFCHSKKILHASAGFFVFQTSPRCDIMHAEGRCQSRFFEKTGEFAVL